MSQFTSVGADVQGDALRVKDLPTQVWSVLVHTLWAWGLGFWAACIGGGTGGLGVGGR